MDQQLSLTTEWVDLTDEEKLERRGAGRQGGAAGRGEPVIVLQQRVFGLPVAQGRPRARHFQDRGGQTRVSVYDPATSRDWKRTVLAQCLEAKPPAPVEGPLAMRLEFYLPRGVSLPKRVVHHITKPDVSNLVKAVEDALAGVVYHDDKQIVSLCVEKRYSPTPGVLIRIERVVSAPKTEPQQSSLITAPA